MAYNISVAVGDKLTILNDASGATVVSGVELLLPHAARTRVAASAAVSARIRDILIIDMVLPPGNWRKKSGSQ
jgi:hypothetical protein